MLTIETLRKVIKQSREQAKNVKYCLFISQVLGEKFGLKDGQILPDGVQVIFTKKIKAA